MRDYMKERVEDYISGDIMFIEEEISNNRSTTSELDDLYYLKHLTDEKIENIVNKLLSDDDLENKINELIHYYLFH
jgi:uncharacterized protein YaaN involved in tellurite resistance